MKTGESLVNQAYFETESSFHHFCHDRGDDVASLQIDHDLPGPGALQIKFEYGKDGSLIRSVTEYLIMERKSLVESTNKTGGGK